jgi:hypothetical protein
MDNIFSRVRQAIAGWINRHSSVLASTLLVDAAGLRLNLTSLEIEKIDPLHSTITCSG